MSSAESFNGKESNEKPSGLSDAVWNTWLYIRSAFGTQVAPEELPPDPATALAQLPSDEDLVTYLKHSTCRMTIPVNSEKGGVAINVSVEPSSKGDRFIFLEFRPTSGPVSGTPFGFDVDASHRTLGIINHSSAYLSEVCGDMYGDSINQSRQYLVLQELKRVFNVR